MHKYYFLHFGYDCFESFKHTIVSDENAKLKSKSKFFGKFFDSLSFNNKKYEIQKVYLGWFYSLFQIGSKLFHGGFLKSSFVNGVMEVSLPFSELSKIEDLSCGPDKYFFTTENGMCYVCSDFMIHPIIPNANEPSLKIKNVTSCDIYNVLLTYDGQVFIVQYSDAETITRLLLPCVITQITCGKEHILMLSNTGEIYSFGCGSRGQLGHGDITNQEEPLLIEALEGIQILSIAAGGWHSAAISSSGDLYMWGWNESGQLGMPCKELQMDKVPLKNIETICCLPKHVPFKDDLKVTSVSCGSRHSAAITEDSSLWTWGWNEYGQLGHKNCNLSDQPDLVELPSGFVLHQIKCKFWSTLVSGTFV